MPGHFTPKERAPGTNWVGGYVGPRAGLNTVVKRKFPAPARTQTPIQRTFRKKGNAVLGYDCCKAYK